MGEVPENPIVAPPPEAALLRTEAVALIDEARKVQIRSQVDYAAAGRELVRVAANIKAIKAAFAEPKRKAHEAHRAISRLESELLRLPEEAERIIKGGMATYNAAEQKRIRQEEARIADRLKKEEEDRRIAEAESLAAAGHRIEAEATLDLPVAAPVVEIQKPSAAGVSMRRKWTYKIIDATKIFRSYLMPDEKKIHQIVTALGPEAEAAVGGIEVLEDTVVSVRT